MVPPLAAAGCRVIVPYLRGYGPTRFLSRGDPALRPAGGAGPAIFSTSWTRSRSDRVLVGYDWGGRPPASSRRYGRSGCGPCRRRLQHPEYRRLARPRRRTRSTALVPVLFPRRRGRAGLQPTATRCVSCCGACGRRTGNSTAVYAAARRRSTTRISSTSSSSPIATASARAGRSRLEAIETARRAAGDYRADHRAPRHGRRPRGPARPDGRRTPPFHRRL